MKGFYSLAAAFILVGVSLWLLFPWQLPLDSGLSQKLEPFPDQVDQYFSHENLQWRFVPAPTQRRDGFQRRGFNLELSGEREKDQRTLSGVEYIPEDHSKGAVLVVPILGGRYGVASEFCRYLAKGGIRSIYIRRSVEFSNANTLEDLNFTLRQLIIDQRLGLDFLQDSSGPDTPLGILGVSMGGILSCILTAVDQRPSASVLIMAGSKLSEVLVQTRGRTMVKLRERLMKIHGWNQSDLKSHLEQGLRYDPSALTSHISRDKILLFLTLFDGYIPFDSQLTLRQGLGLPEAYLLPTGHYTARIYIQSIQSRSLEFFQRRFQDS